MKRTCEFHPADELRKEGLCNQKIISNLINFLAIF